MIKSYKGTYLACRIRSKRNKRGTYMDKIIVDGMGGDNAPASTCAGVARALNEDRELYIILTGQKDKLQSCLGGLSYPADRLEIVD